MSSVTLFISHQLSGRRTVLAEWTKHGSANVGELRIFREYSLDEAMTIKLGTSMGLDSQGNVCISHVEHTNGTEGPRIPLFFVTLHSGIHRIRKFPDDWYSPLRAREMTFFISVHCLFDS